jgi:hypothetical protein
MKDVAPGWFVVASIIGSFACDSDSSRTTERAGILGEASAKGGEPPGPGRRWVLRDADNVAIDAVVEPTCAGDGPGCVVNEVGSNGPITPQCVRVVRLGDAHVDLRYLLSNGRVADCIDSAANPWILGRFADPECAGPVHSPGEYGVDEAQRFVRRAVHLASDGQIYFQGGPPVVQKTWYAGQSCVEVVDATPYFEWFPVPEEIANALPNPPYVLTWE